jgi:hypothetical protein
MWNAVGKATLNFFKTLNTELNPICHLLALLGARHILHLSKIRFNTFFFIFSIPLCVGKYIVIKITVKHNLSYLPWLQGVVIKHFFWLLKNILALHFKIFVLKPLYW